MHHAYWSHAKSCTRSKPHYVKQETGRHAPHPPSKRPITGKIVKPMKCVLPLVAILHPPALLAHSRAVAVWALIPIPICAYIPLTYIPLYIFPQCIFSAYCIHFLIYRLLHIFCDSAYCIDFQLHKAYAQHEFRQLHELRYIGSLTMHNNIA